VTFGLQIIENFPDRSLWSQETCRKSGLAILIIKRLEAAGCINGVRATTAHAIGAACRYQNRR
jgi:hypothetical protein